jgi:hypothetical protein
MAKKDSEILGNVPLLKEGAELIDVAAVWIKSTARARYNRVKGVVEMSDMPSDSREFLLLKQTILNLKVSEGNVPYGKPASKGKLSADLEKVRAAIEHCLKVSVFTAEVQGQVQVTCQSDNPANPQMEVFVTSEHEECVRQMHDRISAAKVLFGRGMVWMKEAS